MQLSRPACCQVRDPVHFERAQSLRKSNHMFAKISFAAVLSVSSLLAACGGNTPEAKEPEAAVAEERASKAEDATAENTDRAEKAADKAEGAAADSDKSADKAEKAADAAKK